jgi:2-polyprenyl-3-methyl-5-hydroxy-6-metoxy-1,4-benzoquinol methylase
MTSNALEVPLGEHTEAPISPLCPSEGVVVEKTFSREEIIHKYSRYLGIDVAEDLADCSCVLLCRGRESNLRFFWPSHLAGNGRFYEKLMMKPHYYMGDKWEHLAVLQMLAPRQEVLEVGCGSGHFLSMAQQAGHSATGIEINDQAIANGRALGLDIRAGTVEQFGTTCTSPFDVVCAFQVLEHVTSPCSFIESSLRCLREGGLAIFAVPNGEGVFSSLDVALDLPPHHMLRWNSAAFQYLTKLFPIVLEDVQFEPMSRLHLGMLATVCFNDLSLPQRGLAAFRRKLVGTLVSKYWDRYYSELNIAGHSLLVVFRKRPAEARRVQ